MLRPAAAARVPVIRSVLAGLLLAACSPTAIALSAPEAPSPAEPVSLPGVEVSTDSDAGSIAVAYPDVPEAWVQPLGDDLAAADLAAVWGLPLFRVDDHGQLRPGLVADFQEREDDGGFVVELALRAGEWSDGSPVTAADVVATIEALQTADAPPLQNLTDVREVDGRVRLRFSERTAAWPYLLLGSGGVLPKAILDEQGLDAYANDIPVSGGWFRLEAHDPGRSARFVANDRSPLGRAAVDELTVLFVPRYEAALGFLANGQAHAVLGHLGLNPVERAEQLENITGSAPLGGTSVVLEVRQGGRLSDQSAEVRRQVMSAVEVGQLVEGLLGEAGVPANSMFPGLEGPFVDQRLGVSDAPDVVLLVQRWHETLGFTARTIERDLESHQVVADLVSEETPMFTRTARARYDLVLRIRRDPPIPTLTPYADPDDRSLVASGRQLEGIDLALQRAGLVRPLYRAAPAHAWHDDLQGIRPSAWPGLAFWNVGSWVLKDS